MKQEYQVSVIIPAYNSERFVEQGIQSVLEQTVACKIIVINDASRDNTLEILEKMQAQYPEQITIIHKTTNQGVSAARNSGLKMVDTKYVAYLDADDWWSNEKIEKQIEALKQTGAKLCYTGRELMTETGESMERVVEVPQVVTYPELLKGNVVPCSSVLLETAVALDYLWSHDELHEDYIMWLSMLRDEISFVGINEPLLKSRMAAGGKSRDKWKSAKMTYEVYKHMGIPFPQRIWCFINYALQGVRKYF